MLDLLLFTSNSLEVGIVVASVVILCDEENRPMSCLPLLLCGFNNLLKITSKALETSPKHRGVSEESRISFFFLF